MKTNTYHIALSLLLAAHAADAPAGGSAAASAKALEHAVQAVGYSLESGFKLVSGAVAVPLTLSGELGQASGDLGAQLWDAANAPPGEPFPISDEIVTARPPAPAENSK